MAIIASLGPFTDTESFKLIDPDILEIHKQLQLHNDNFELHRNFLKAYKIILPYLGAVSANKNRILEASSILEVSPHSNLLALGQLYEPLILLKINIDFFLIKNESNLPYELKKYIKVETSNIDPQFHTTKFLIPDLSECTVNMLRKAIRGFEEHAFR